MKKTIIFLAAAALLSGCRTSEPQPTQLELFRDGNYAMFIHFGLYSELESEWNGKAYYGNAEWIMSPKQAGIPRKEYMSLAASFNPAKFNADSIVRLAKDAGMKYIVITSKHHEGFAMFHSDCSDFNIVDATPFGRDVIGELSAACHREGLGIGYYYSQSQDWTEPGGRDCPDNAELGVTFDEYYHKKCAPQVEELTTKYGPIEVLWFDTPGDMAEKYSRDLIEIVRKNQPGALVSSRVGNGLGDYETLGDMEVPLRNVPGLWEGIDVMQVGWGYSKFDTEWKSPDYIVRNLVSTVARGGTFMMNVGPTAEGIIPSEAAASLRKAGEWIRRYPDAVYGADPSPWNHAQPWGDALIAKDGKLMLAVYDWPKDGKLWIHGLKTRIKGARLCGGRPLKFSYDSTWTCINVPLSKPDDIAPVVELKLAGEAVADTTFAVDPGMKTVLPVMFASMENCSIKNYSWNERFGEWKHKSVVMDMDLTSSVTWDFEVKDPGFYCVGLELSASAPVEWTLTTDEGRIYQNQVGASNAYAFHNYGWVRFDTPGRHEIRLKEINNVIPDLRLSAVSIEKVDL